MALYDNVASLSPIYAEAHKRWALVDALMDGLQAMLDKGYICKEIMEEDERYKLRIGRASLTNFYKTTVESHVGKVFAKDIELKGFSANMETWCEDINLDGQNITQFAKQVFLDAYNKGVSFMLTDMPVIAPNEDGSPRTRRQDQLSNVRPYLVHIPAANVIGSRTQLINGKNEIIQFHYFEVIDDYTTDVFKPSQVRQIKVLTPGKWQILRQNVQSEKWELYDEGDTGLGLIPLTVFYTNRGINNLVGAPPLEDLAYKTLQYYRAENGLDNYIHTANLPMMQFKGPAPEPDEYGKVKKLDAGPNVITYTGNSQNELAVVEHKGHAVTASMKRLELMREEMELLGLAPLVNTARTATEANLNSFRADAALRACAISLKDALEQALMFFNEYDIKEEAMGEVTVNTEYNFVEPTIATPSAVKGNKVQQQDAVDPEVE